jgi:phospholipase/lecithinase/hemolysin
MRKKLLSVLFPVLFIFLSSATHVLAYSSIVSFGDSLSDNGNADGYGLDVYTNGDVWVDYLAKLLNADLLDMAYGGARTYGHPGAPAAEPDMFGLVWQVEQYLGMDSISTGDTLYTMWAGGNDLLNIGALGVGETITTAVTNIADAVGDLAQAGAENVVVMNMPNLGATPLMNGSEESYNNGMMLSIAFNNGLNQSLSIFANTGLNLIIIDVFGLMDDLIKDSVFDNDTDMLSVAGQTSDSYMFWDWIHPTTYTHSLIADAVYAEITTVPEPTTLLLFSFGLIGIVGIRRKTPAAA